MGARREKMNEGTVRRHGQNLPCKDDYPSDGSDAPVEVFHVG